MEIWKYSPGKLKAHTSVEFGRVLMRTLRSGNDRKRITWSAVYRDRTGRIVGYDFVIQSRERSRIGTLHKQFEGRKSGTESGEIEAESIAEITQSDIII
jgi:hypothetical protein